MLLIILVLLWGAFLVPAVVRKIRDWRNEQSIEHFHLEHDVLSRRAVVAPLHRLDERDEYEDYGAYTEYGSDGDGYANDYPAPRRVAPADRGSARVTRPRLTVVHDDDTYQTIESRSSWDDWAADYEFDEPSPRRASASSRVSDERSSRARPASNRYVAAYSSTPSTSPVLRDARATRRSMRARRRVVFIRLVLAAVVLTVAAVAAGYSFVWDLAILAWIGVVAFVALALYAVSRGYLHESSVGLGGRRQSLATVEPLDRYRRDDEWRGEPDYDDYERSDAYNARSRNYADTTPARSAGDVRFDRYALG